MKCQADIPMTKSKLLVLFFNPVRYVTETYQCLSAVAKTEVVLIKSREESFEDIATKYKNAAAICGTSASGTAYTTNYVPS